MTIFPYAVHYMCLCILCIIVYVWEDTLEKGMSTHSSIIAWKIPWTEKPGGLQFMGLQKVRHDWVCTEKGVETGEENRH